ncbi:hypothetical protein IE53DRAFT_390113 [Violaceomyces palustris]|uniref:Uncharacterized protein n=1 Tax=Violaceomyces palustris TaxID=1673888 RepID=A0ACD0NPK8_9BASI|nr:hypothetical protein IE53DRAFT_390113 [Violaceomyces palustris]
MRASIASNLPPELLRHIIELTLSDFYQFSQYESTLEFFNEEHERQSKLPKLLTVNRHWYQVVSDLLYSRPIQIPRCKTLVKFLNSMSRDPRKKDLVRHLIFDGEHISTQEIDVILSTLPNLRALVLYPCIHGTGIVVDQETKELRLSYNASLPPSQSLRWLCFDVSPDGLVDDPQGPSSVRESDFELLVNTTHRLTDFLKEGKVTEMVTSYWPSLVRLDLEALCDSPSFRAPALRTITNFLSSPHLAPELRILVLNLDTSDDYEDELDSDEDEDEPVLHRANREEDRKEILNLLRKASDCFPKLEFVEIAIDREILTTRPENLEPIEFGGRKNWNRKRAKNRCQFELLRKGIRELDLKRVSVSLQLDGEEDIISWMHLAGSDRWSEMSFSNELYDWTPKAQHKMRSGQYTMGELALADSDGSDPILEQTYDSNDVWEFVQRFRSRWLRSWRGALDD